MARAATLWLCALGACALLLGGCGSSDDADKNGASSKVTDNIASFKFVPKDVKLKAGGTITWTNQDKAPHTATSEPGAPAEFDTGRLELGQTKSIKLDKPGKYPYFCEFHRFMTGTVEVVE